MTHRNQGRFPLIPRLPSTLPLMLAVCLALILALAPASSGRSQTAAPEPLKSSQAPRDPVALARQQLLEHLEKAKEDSTLLDRVRKIMHFILEKSEEKPSDVLATMGPGDRVPGWLLPHNTRLLTVRPTFFWQAVPGVRGYRVALFQGNPETGCRLWEVTASTAKLPYPGRRPSLKSGQSYVWKVWAAGFREGAQGQFEVAAPEEIKKIQAGAGDLKRDLGKALPEAQVLLLVGGFYAQQGYHLAALGELARARKLAPADPLIQAASCKAQQAMGLQGD